MSEDPERGFGRVNGHRDRSRSGTNQPPETPSRESNFRDGSGPLFDMYLKIGEEEDIKMIERWQNDADGILIFTGLFSAAVATLLSVTVLNIMPNSQGTSAFNFPQYAIWVNSLWFLSLVISLTCAMLAMLLQQWARRYIRSTRRPRYSPHKRARIRAFFYDGVDKSFISWVVEALPTLLHLSLSLFFAGLLVLLFGINHPVFRVVAWWVALSAVAYIFITLLPIFRPDTPYYAPLSSTVWCLSVGVPYAVFHVLSSPVLSRFINNADGRFDVLREHYYKQLSGGIEKTAEEIAGKSSSENDFRILETTFDAMGEDSALAKFFEAIPGFFGSDVVSVNDPQECPNPVFQNKFREFQNKFGEALDGFLDRTFSSNWVPETDRGQRLLISLNAAYTVLGSDGLSKVLFQIRGGRWGLLHSIEMGHSLRRLNNIGAEITPSVRWTVTQIVAGIQERNERWISLVKAEFGIPDRLFQDNIGGDDSVLLAILIYVTRQAFRSRREVQWVLWTLSRFNICNTRSALQHEFCTLWNQIVEEAWRGDENNPAVQILREIRHAYIGLHSGTALPTALSAHTNPFNPVLDKPYSYRFCDRASHRPESHLSVRPQTLVVLASPAASTTQLGDSPSPSPRFTALEIQRLPSNDDTVIFSCKTNLVHAAPQQAEEADIILRCPSPAGSVIALTDYPRHTHPSPTQTTYPVHVTQQVIPLANTSVPESIGTIEVNGSTRDSNPIGSMEAAHQSLLSVPDDDAAHMTLPDDPPSDICSSKPKSHAHSVTSPPYPHPDSVSTTTAHSTESDLSSFSVPDPGHVSDGSQHNPLDTMLPPESNKWQDSIASPCVASVTTGFSSTAKPIRQSIPSRRAASARQRNEETTLLPAIVVSDSLSSYTLMSPSRIPAEPCSSVGSILIQSDDTSQPPSKSTHSHAIHAPIPLKILDQPAPPAPHIVSNIFRPEDVEDGLNMV